MPITAATIAACIKTFTSAISLIDKITQMIESETIRGDIAKIKAQLIQSNNLILQLQAEISDSRAEIEKLRAKDNFRNDYVLVNVGTGFAYRLKPLDKRLGRLDEPVHFICQSCADAKGIRTVMRRLNGNNLYCSRCDRIMADRIPEEIFDAIS